MMNNEEKILSILESMQGDIKGLGKRMDSMESKMDSMESKMDSMERRMDSMESRMDNMETTLTRVALTQENIVLPRIQALAEGQGNIVAMMAKEEDLQVVKEDVAILKSAVKSHAVSITELQAAK